ncbi:MAG: nucleoside phosphorylase [Mycobacteriales bacterium]
MDIALTEFDDSPTALIEPSQVITPIDPPLAVVVCFFREVIERLAARADARQVVVLKAAHGHHPIWEIDVEGQRLGVFHPGVGAPLAAAFMEEAIAYGCQRFVACGGAGVLVPDLVLGHVVVVDSALRDEGTSFHYLPPGRIVNADPGSVRVVSDLLTQREVPHLTGRTWTTDAIYRETRGKVERRRAEGCLTVEMEAAALIAVAQFRRVPFAQLLYAGDSLAGDTWDSRAWTRAHDVREELFWLAAAAALRLPELAQSPT